MDRNSITALRMQRQYLAKPADNKEEYNELFRLMQPATTLYFSRPGDPPSLVHRSDFDDRFHNDIRRGSREIVKARFQGGNVGYVDIRDFELYIAAFRKPIDKLTFKQKYIYDTITHTGPLGPRQIKEETGILNKEIMPVLHRLQEAFLVFEDQVDSEWDRAWYNFENEWYDIDINKYGRIEAIAAVLERFLKVYVFATVENMKDWSRLTLKDIKEAVKTLQEEKKIISVRIGNVEGYMLDTDFELLKDNRFEIKQSAFMLHKSDLMARANESMLKEKYKDLEVLQYLLIDGEFKGAVVGHWRIGPHDVEDIVVELSEEQKQHRKQEIIKAIEMFYKTPFSNILRYSGEIL